MIALDLATFRALYPEFADVAAFPDQLITIRFETASGFVSLATCSASGPYLMTAHLMALSAQRAAGDTAGIVLMSKVGDVSVQLAQPPWGTDAWRYWLNLTPYGQELLALLEVNAVGGTYVGGLPERSAFRKVGGIF